MKALIAGLGLWGMVVTTWAQPQAVPVPEAEPAEAPVEMPREGVVTSRTKQFRISGGNALGRGLCAILAENAKEELLRMLERKDAWKIPINVVLYGEPGDKAPANCYVTRLKVVEGVYTVTRRAEH